MEMGKEDKKGVALLIGIGKGGMGKMGKEEEPAEDDMGGEEAAKELLSAIESKDPAAVYEAMKNMVSMCSE